MLHPEDKFKPQAPVDVWARLFADVPRSVQDELAGLIDIESVPPFFDFASSALAGDSEHRKPGSLSRALLAHGVLIRAVADPVLLSAADARHLMQLGLQLDPLLDVKLLQHLSPPDRVWPEGVHADDALRILMLLELAPGLGRLAIPLLRFAGHPHPWVRSKGARLFGKTAPSAVLIEKVFQDSDSRVQANVLEGLADRPAPLPDAFLTFARKASTGAAPRIQSLALLVLARSGDADAREALHEMMQHANPRIRKTGEWASKKLGLGELQPVG